MCQSNVGLGSCKVCMLSSVVGSLGLGWEQIKSCWLQVHAVCFQLCMYTAKLPQTGVYVVDRTAVVPRPAYISTVVQIVCIFNIVWTVSQNEFVCLNCMSTCTSFDKAVLKYQTSLLLLFLLLTFAFSCHFPHNVPTLTTQCTTLTTQCTTMAAHIKLLVKDMHLVPWALYTFTYTYKSCKHTCSSYTHALSSKQTVTFYFWPCMWPTSKEFQRPNKQAMF